MSGVPIWLVGEVHAPELSAPVSWLRSMARHKTFSDLAAAMAAARHPAHGESPGGEPDAIIFCLARPGQISRASLEEIERALPLSQLLALVGPWCEGEVRSGRPWPGVKRIYWHQWRPRLIAELARLGQPDASRLPRSATEVDALLSRGALAVAPRPALVGVVSRRQCDFEALALGLEAGGHHPVWVLPGDALPVLKLDALIVDGQRDAAEATEWLRAAQDRAGPIPAIVLCHFPRPNELAEPGDNSAMAILTKPYLVSDLLARLAELLSARGTTLAAPASAAA